MIDIPRLGFNRVIGQRRFQNFYIRTAIDEFALAHPHDEGRTIGPAKREYVTSKSAIALLVYCPSAEQLLMSRQFRMPVMFDTGDVEKSWIYEVIAGVIDNNDSPWDTAVREAQEEAGIAIDSISLVRVAELYLSPGMTSEKMNIFTCAVGSLVPVARNGGLEHEAEAIVSEWISYEAAKKLLAEEKIKDAKTFIALKSIGL